MYLNRAEAIARGASVSGVTADADLKVITSNRGAADVTATISSILLERRKELAFEGHIFFDYKRLIGTRYERDMVRTDVASEMNKDVPVDSKYWCMPIAESEFDVNPNLKQNPKW